MFRGTFGKAGIFENQALYQKLVCMLIKRSFDAPTGRPLKQFHHTHKDEL